MRECATRHWWRTAPCPAVDCEQAVVVLNGDSTVLDPVILNSINRLRENYLAGQVQDKRRYGFRNWPDGQVLAFTEKSSRSPAGLVSAGVYLFERQAVAEITDGVVLSLETDVFPRYVGQGLYAVVGSGPFLDIGTPESYAEADQYLEKSLGIGQQT